MIHAVHTSSTPSTPTAPETKPGAGAAAKSTTSFADAHAAAVRASAASTSPATPSTVTAASGETWTPISGVSAYAKITGGPRTGQYVDLTKGAHHGRAFTIEQRDGQDVHVFKGADGAEDVVPAARNAGHHRAAANARPAKGETWAPVEGHSGYADILSGSRNGLYVNLSGGPREGQAFQLERRGDQMLHIYGEGKDRQVIAMPVHHAAAKKTTPKSSGGAQTPTAKG
jgi:hypothetical protein